MTIAPERPPETIDFPPVAPPPKPFIPEYALAMSGTKRITVTLPTEQVELMRQYTTNISGFVADAVSEHIRSWNRSRALAEYQEQHGPFTEDERAAARARLNRVYVPDEEDSK
ncbi:type II toxin-antitoxin system CcdA family antitoxin [Myceligenerans crystallogenes]|uniref:Post-segregation antitoxin CcdA n=1 Tax=Myceligenerans crystallogenes TaxID=316335 RepID=A0ABN2N4R8_9MICO